VTRRRLFGSLCAMVFLVNLGRVIFAPLLEPLRVTFQTTGGTIGLLATLTWVGSALLRLPTGYALTRVPRHYVVATTGTVLTAASIFTAVAVDVRMLLVGAFFMGLASGAYFIAANPLVSELFPDRVGSALGVHGMASQLAAVTAPLLVTAVLARWRWETTFQIIAVVAAATTVAFTLVAWRTDLPDAGAEDRNMLAAIRGQWPIILTGVLMLGVTGFVWQGMFNFYVTYLKVGKGLAEPTARTLLSVAFGAGVPAFVITGRLADRVPVVSLILAILAGFVALIFTLTATSGILALAVVSAALGYTVHSLFPAVDTYLLGSLPDHHRASAYAAYSASMMTIQAGGSWALGELTDTALTFDTVFRTFGGALGVLVLALVLAHVLGVLPTKARVGVSG
jgi:DHA1 family inner membrane transport protein